MTNDELDDAKITNVDLSNKFASIAWRMRHWTYADVPNWMKELVKPEDFDEAAARLREPDAAGGTGDDASGYYCSLAGILEHAACTISAAKNLRDLLQEAATAILAQDRKIRELTALRSAPPTESVPRDVAKELADSLRSFGTVRACPKPGDDNSVCYDGCRKHFPAATHSERCKAIAAALAAYDARGD